MNAVLEANNPLQIRRRIVFALETDAFNPDSSLHMGQNVVVSKNLVIDAFQNSVRENRVSCSVRGFQQSKNSYVFRISCFSVLEIKAYWPMFGVAVRPI